MNALLFKAEMTTAVQQVLARFCDKRLGDEHGLVRVAAAETLWELGGPAAEVLSVLNGALGHKLATVRLHPRRLNHGRTSGAYA
jgi:hypothetical protein